MVLGTLTLGVYLVHPLMLDVVRVAALPGRPLGGLSPLGRLLLQWTFALSASTALVWLWHRSRRLTQLLG
jgi:surface polysaccharide O-acyltransferase-like enzyme